MAKSSQKDRKSEDRSQDSPVQAEAPPAGFLRRHLTGTFGQTGLGLLLLWMALPPLGWWPLAFVAPVSWIVLIRRKELPGQRPYRAIWLAGFLFWLAELYWMSLALPVRNRYPSEQGTISVELWILKTVTDASC